MKTLTKSLLAATLALGSVSANAAIDNSKTFDSEAFLSVYDSASKGTFTLDLGVNISTLVANLNNANFALSYDLSVLSDWNAFKAAAGTLTGAVYSVTAGGVNASFNPYVLATGSVQFITGQEWTALNTGVNKINEQAQLINEQAGDMFNTVANNTTFVVDGVGKGHHGAANSLWNSPLGHNPNTAYGDLVDFQMTKLNASFSANEVFTSVSQWKLAGDELTLVAPSAVPVPAAVWLFGTALLGLFGNSRRRKAV